MTGAIRPATLLLSDKPMREMHDIRPDTHALLIAAAARGMTLTPR